MGKIQLATNIIDLLECRGIKDLMCVHGFVWEGSAYDRFRALCICAERHQNAPVVLRIENYLREVFGSELTLNSSTCPQIWVKTAERLLLGDVTPNAFQDVSPNDVCMPTATDFDPQKCFPLNDLRIEANEWGEWKRKAEEILCSALREGRILSVDLTKNQMLAKTSLYQANRVIAEGDWDHPAWITQLVLFLCDFCASHHTRACIFCPDNGATLHEILQHVSKQTRLPCFYVGCMQPWFEALLPVCRMIRSERATSEEGIPPVLVFNPS